MNPEQIQKIDQEIERQETIIMLRHARNMLEAMLSVYFPNFDQASYLKSIDDHLEKLKSREQL